MIMSGPEVAGRVTAAVTGRPLPCPRERCAMDAVRERCRAACGTRGAWGLGLVSLLLFAAVPRLLADPPARRGGLLPSRGGSEYRWSSRESLIRSWDKNSDGKIDEIEAELARSQMRRERSLLLMDSAVGLDEEDDDRKINEALRDEDAAAADRFARPDRAGSGPDRGGLRSPLGDPAARGGPAGLGGPAQDEAAEPAPPTFLGPAGASTQSTAERQAGDGGGAAAAAAVPTRDPLGDRNAAALPGARAGNRSSRGRLLGGVRAGAPAVRQGYGAPGRPADLNAGRLPGGPPAVRGTTVQPGAWPFRMAPTSPAAARPRTPPPRPVAPRPPSTPAEFFGP